MMLGSFIYRLNITLHLKNLSHEQKQKKLSVKCSKTKVEIVVVGIFFLIYSVCKKMCCIYVHCFTQKDK